MTGCTPIWLAALIALVSIAGTHLLTRNRERGKALTELNEKWRERFRRELDSVVAAAVKHYCSSDSLNNTEFSSASIVTSFRSLRRVLDEARFKNGVDHRRAREALAALNVRITGADSFQRSDRLVIPSDAPLIESINAAADDVHGFTTKPLGTIASGKLFWKF